MVLWFTFCTSLIDYYKCNAIYLSFSDQPIKIKGENMTLGETISNLRRQSSQKL